MRLNSFLAALVGYRPGRIGKMIRRVASVFLVVLVLMLALWAMQGFNLVFHEVEGY